jgi:hypothetical protein
MVCELERVQENMGPTCDFYGHTSYNPLKAKANSNKFVSFFP